MTTNKIPVLTVEDYETLSSSKRVGPEFDLTPFISGIKRSGDQIAAIVRLPIARPKELWVNVYTSWETKASKGVIVPLPPGLVWWCAPLFAPVRGEAIHPISERVEHEGSFFACDLVVKDPPVLLSATMADDKASIKQNMAMGCYFVEFGGDTV